MQNDYEKSENDQTKAAEMIALYQTVFLNTLGSS